ncbi:MAG: hypothetical protein A2657_01510 [Candidatus Yanofskybacteria bacterium RIFCSPHIGHO2_01_FULL_44_110b]|nr:MAG: hypothetical protein A2657_01510 [Candidatus Yanofskybacteria bacterium RIFCSPHIGHO2_01_FULL_44_110b]
MANERKSRNHLDNYAPLYLRVESIRDSVDEFRNPSADLDIGGLTRLNHRALFYLFTAAIRLHTALCFLVDYAPTEQVGRRLEQIIADLEGALEGCNADRSTLMDPSPANLGAIEKHMKLLLTVVIRATNICNNHAPGWVPEERLRPFLEARDYGDRAIRCPSIISES